jgi:hypothetical protein
MPSDDLFREASAGNGVKKIRLFSLSFETQMHERALSRPLESQKGICLVIERYRLPNTHPHLQSDMILYFEDFIDELFHAELV